jgi:hypothetical protein
MMPNSEKITWTTTEQPAPVVRTFQLLVLMCNERTRDATPADLALAGYEPKSNAATEALDAIAKLCGCEQWQYPGQVVRDVESLRARLAEVEAKRDKLQTRLTEWTTGKTQAFFVPSLGYHVNAKQLIGDLEAMSAGTMIARVQNAESALTQAQQWRRDVLKALELGEDGNAFERIQNLLDNEDQYPALEKELEKAREELVALREVAEAAREYVNPSNANSPPCLMRHFDAMRSALSKLSALPGTEAQATAGDAPSGPCPECAKADGHDDLIDGETGRLGPCPFASGNAKVMGDPRLMQAARDARAGRPLVMGSPTAPPAAPSDWRETAGIPRRNCLDRLTPAELAIRAAIDAVEMAGADVLLTQTVVLLGQAADKLADYIDGTKPEPVYDIGQERDAASPAAPSEKVARLVELGQAHQSGYELGKQVGAGVIRVEPSEAGAPESATMLALSAEMQRARRKFPGNRLLLAALTEEVGELAKELLENRPRLRVREEAIQVACVALRIYEEGDATFAAASPAPPPSEQGGEWTVCRPCRGTGVITGQSASDDAGEG